MNKKDYYEVLEIDRSATEADIKQAYRKMARKYHPDVSQDTDKKQAEERFKEINEAYEVLSDKQKRATYDQYGHDAFRGGAGGFGGGSALAALEISASAVLMIYLICFSNHPAVDRPEEPEINLREGVI